MVFCWIEWTMDDNSFDSDESSNDNEQLDDYRY